MAEEVQVDESLYSRALLVYGLDAMKRLASSSVLISGMGGLGVEIAKNVILAGVQRVTVHDVRSAELRDLASNFYLSEQSIGQNRALASLSQLSSLNDYVSVTAETCPLTDDFLSRFKCVVLTDSLSESELFRIANFCRANGIYYIISESRGLFGYLFNDFGPRFVVQEPTAREPSRFLINFISNANPAMLDLVEGEVHGLGYGSIIRIEGVEGMTELNGKEFEVEDMSPTVLKVLTDTTNLPPYGNGKVAAVGTEVIHPKIIEFKPFADALKNPEAFQYDTKLDMAHYDRDQQVVLAFLAAARALDQPGDFIEIARAVNSEFSIVETIDESLLKEFEREKGAVICPTCATLGGIVGQEAIKAVSSKFVPAQQFAGIGWIEALPTTPIYTPINDRYDPYRQVFGNETQAKFQEMKYFLIGAGALGCEQLKNFALMGVGTRGSGKVVVTDMDQIERSNLSRQFLFRNSDIGQMKSVAAAAAARAMNPEFQVEAHTNRLAEDTLNVYNDSFYQSLSGVCNALDNFTARIFSDSRCLLYRLPLMDGGTLGATGDFQPIVPDVTGHYRGGGGGEGRGIPMCTLHHFPTSIEHTTMWAKDAFAGFFDDGPRAAIKFADPGFSERAQAESISVLEAAKTFVVTERCATFSDCARWARLKFEQLFHWKILDLQKSYPEDAVTEEGIPFWSGSKRYPRPAVFDPTNKVHASFVTAGAHIRARVSAIAPSGDALALASAVDVPPWQPAPPPADANVDALVAELRDVFGSYVPAVPEEFEKDDDANGHVDFIAAAANIRAMNYGIEPKERLAIKKIAGRIIPAVATSTAMVCGFISLEMYKVHAIEKKKIESFRYGLLDLGTPIFTIVEPQEPQVKWKSPTSQKVYTVWDQFFIEGDLTLAELLDVLKEKYEIVPESISGDAGTFYGLLADDDPKLIERLGRKISETLVLEFNAPPLADGQTLLHLELGLPDCYSEDETPPPVLLKIR